MRTMTGFWVALLWMAVAGDAMAQVDLTPYLKRDAYETIKISPDGRHLAATVPMDDRTGMVILDRIDKRIVTRAIGVEHSAVADFWWADDKRVVIAMAQALGSRDTAYLTGELHALEIGGSRVTRLVGETSAAGLVESYGAQQPRDFATLIDTLPEDPDNVLIAIAPLSNDPLTRIEKLDVQHGRRRLVASAPARRAEFSVDAKGVVRFAQGSGNDNYSRLYYRDDADAKWQLVNDEATSGRLMSVLGLSADGGTAYMRVNQDKGADVIEAWDTHTHTGKPLLADAGTDPYALIFDRDGRTPVGVQYMGAGVRSVFFDASSPMALMYRGFEQGFPGMAVTVTSTTRDGSLALLRVWDDRTPGDYYLFDTASRRATGVYVQREWLQPKTMAPSRQITLTARDGVTLHGYLSVPVGSSGKSLPMVVLPHGGPYGIFDGWGFDTETQILASAGYAVLRVNYRGSGNYGLTFRRLGAREWGGTMQDDLTDATRWAIAQGTADDKRICIYGASYGGYAALMGVAKEPSLYQCAVGYVGVYDLVAMHRDDSRAAKWVHSWADDWIGERGDLEARSPVELAERIKVPVFLAAGGKDPRAPIEHSKKMERALRKADVPVTTLYYDNEGHGFTTEEHRRAFYTQLLDFLAVNIGGSKAKAQ